MRKALVQLDARVHPLGVAPVRPVEHVHKSSIALAEKHNLHIVFQDVAQHALHEVEPLLRGEPRDHTDERHVPLLQAAFLLQRALAKLLSIQMVRVKVFL